MTGWLAGVPAFVLAHPLCLGLAGLLAGAAYLGVLRWALAHEEARERREADRKYGRA